MYVSQDLTMPFATTDDSDPATNVREYLKRGDQHLIMQESSTAFWAGTFDELSTVREVTLGDDGESIFFSTVEGPDDNTAVLIGVHGVPTLGAEPTQIRTGVVPVSDWSTLGDEPLDLPSRHTFGANLSVIPARAQAKGDFIVAAGEDFAGKNIEAFIFLRDGSLGAKFIPMASVGADVSVSRARAGLQNANILPSFVLAWLQVEAGQGSIYGRRATCTP
jgi:hypothetical protein